MTLSSLEMAVGVLLARQIVQGDANPIVDQLKTAQVSARDTSNFGFLTHFSVDRNLPPAVLTGAPVGWARSEIGPAHCPLEFMLHIRDGYAEMILAFSLHEGYGDLDLLTANFTSPRIVNPHTAEGRPGWRQLKKL